MAKAIKRFMALFLTAVMTITACPKIFEDLSVTAYADSQLWDKAYDKNQCSDISIDKSVYYGNSGYSIKIKNNNYNIASVEKKFNVKKNTYYRATVMVKYSDYSLASYAEREACGATFGQVWTYNLTETYNGKNWKKLAFEFNSGNETEYTIAMYNGLWNGHCKGTAWFSDFRLEECVSKPSNRWNVLAVVFKNVNAKAELDGKKFTHKGSLKDSDVKYMEKVLNNLYTSVPLLSDDIWGFSSIDVVSTDAVVNELLIADENRIDAYSECVSKELDKFIEKAEKESGKKYDQIIAIAPLSGATPGWVGKGGGKYKGIPFCQAVLKSGDDWSKDYKNYPESVFVHEMLHCVERISRDELKAPTKAFHHSEDDPSLENLYWDAPQNRWYGWAAYHSQYMRHTIPGDRGVDKRAFNTYRNVEYRIIYRNGEYKGYDSENEKYPKKDVSKLTISKPKNQAYTGKAIKPKLTVKDGNKTLQEGKDYTLTYLNNKDVGYAAVIVNGKGKYSGKLAQNFKIVPKKNKLTVTKSGSNYTFSWQKNNGAKAFELYVSENGGKSYELLKTVYGDITATTVKIDSGKKLKFKMRSLTEIYPQTFYSSYTSVVTAKKATGNEKLDKEAKEPFKSGKLYTIRCKNGGLVLDIDGISKDNGANLLQWKYVGNPNQKWYLEKQSNGYYKIISYNSDKVLDVVMASKENGANVIQYTDKNSDNQLWKIECVDGYYKIINRNSGKALEVEKSSLENGANVSQNKYKGKDNQLWIIETV